MRANVLLHDPYTLAEKATDQCKTLLDTVRELMVAAGSDQKKAALKLIDTVEAVWGDFRL